MSVAVLLIVPHDTFKILGLYQIIYSKLLLFVNIHFAVLLIHLQGYLRLYICSLVWASQGCVHGSLSDVHIAVTWEKKLRT